MFRSLREHILEHLACTVSYVLEILDNGIAKDQKLILVHQTSFNILVAPTKTQIRSIELAMANSTTFPRYHWKMNLLLVLVFGEMTS